MESLNEIERAMELRRKLETQAAFHMMYPIGNELVSRCECWQCNQYNWEPCD